MPEAEILARLDSLERRHRRLRAGAALAAVAAAVLVLAGAALPEEGAPPASTLVLKEEGGRTLHLGVLPGGRFGILLLDAGGRERLLAEVEEDGFPNLALCDRSGRPRIRASMISDDLAGITLNDGGKRNFRTWWLATKSGPVFDMFDQSGKTRLGLSVLDEGGTAGLSLFNRDGAVRAGLVHEKDDGVRLSLRRGPNDDEKDAAELRVLPGGATNLVLTSADGAATVAFGILGSGTAGFNVLGRDRVPRIVAAASGGTSVIQLCDSKGGKRVEVHALSEEDIPEEARGKAAPASLLLFDGKGEETFRAPGE